MALHDWLRVEAGIFHDFHTVWVGHLRTALNDGLLPEGYYALAEQHAGRSVADVLTLHASPPSIEPFTPPPSTGGTAVAEAPPRVRRRHSITPEALIRRRTLAIRHVSGHRLVALVEIISPANKDRPSHVADFAAKALSALDAGVHLLLIDLLPPGPHDPSGMHGVLLDRLQPEELRYEVPPDEPATLASYAAGVGVEIFVEHVRIGGALPDMPLFLRPDRYVNVPLEPTYEAAYRGLPAFWRQVLEGAKA